MRYGGFAALCAALALLGCGGEDGGSGSGDPERYESRYNGVMLFNTTGLDAFFSFNWLHHGATFGFINHPLDDDLQPLPAYRELVINTGTPSVFRVWPAPQSGALQIRWGVSAETPFEARTLFTDDVLPARLRFDEYTIDDTGARRHAPGRQWEGEAEWEVFAADLVTGALWARFDGTLWPVDGEGEPRRLRTELVAVMIAWDCVWEVESGVPTIDKRLTASAPPGRADACSDLWEQMKATPPHPDAPPVPPFATRFNHVPPRWPGLDRDL